MTWGKAQSQARTPVDPAHERRRNQRVMIRMPVTLHVALSGRPVVLRAVTVAVNDYGAMLLCSRGLPAETRLEMQNDHTRDRAACRVTRAPRESPEGYLIPVEFQAPSSGFWHICFPPADRESSED